MALVLEVHEQVFDAAWSGDRKPDPKTGKVPSVGSPMDIENVTWTNTIGAPALIAVWKDPAFDPSQPRTGFPPRFSPASGLDCGGVISGTGSGRGVG